MPEYGFLVPYRYYRYYRHYTAWSRTRCAYEAFTVSQMRGWPRSRHF